MSTQERIRDEREQIEDALRESERRLSVILQNTPAVVYLMSPESRFLHVNRRFEELFNLKNEEVRGKSVYEVFSPEIAAAFEANNLKVIERSAPVEFEEVAPQADGLHSYTSIKAPFFDADGETSGIVGISTDITERKRADEELLRNSQRLSLLSETASSLLLSDDPQELINSLFGKLSTQLGLEVYFNYLVSEDRQKLRLYSYAGVSEELAKEIEWLEFGQAVCGYVAQHGRHVVAEDIQRSNDQRAKLVQSLGITAYACYPLLAHARLIGTLSFGTRRRHYFYADELALMETVSHQIATALERAQLIAELQRRAEELEQANRLKDEFLATLSHELRTPLTAVLGWTEIMCEGNLNEATRSHGLEVIKRNAEAQQHLIEEILDVSRIITGKLRIELRPMEINGVVEAAIEAVRPAAEAKHIQIRTDFDPDAGLISGDPDRLQQVVWNLLSNAVKFTPEGGHADVRLKRAGSHLRIVVRDDGQGISPDFLPHVFERFRQADQTTARAHNGLGLGLALVRHLVELHGGTVSAESEGEQKGSTFIVELPLVTRKSENGASTPAACRDANQTLCDNMAKLRGMRALVVDDETDMRDLLSVMLRQCGMEVLTAASAVEGLSLLESERPDVLIADIGMPSEDGYALIEKVRALPAAQGGEIPAIALTAYTGVSDRHRSLSKGFQEHVPKPVEAGELASIIANLVGRPAL